MVGIWRQAVILGLAAGCAACTTNAAFDGAPKPVIPLKAAVTIPADFEMEKVTADVGAETDPGRAKLLRNRAIALYMRAMDARYAAFRRALSGESKGWNTGLGIGVLGVSSAGAVAGGAANELAAVAAFLAGSRSVLNKELFFDRTLPALVAAMDGARTRARAALVVRMRDSVVNYPMEMAFADLSTYELAASLEAAIQQVTVDAVARANEADVEYKDATKSCLAPATLAGPRRRLNKYLYGLAAAAKPPFPAAGTPEDAKLVALAKVATALDAIPSAKATSADEAQAQANGVIDVALAACTSDDLDAIFATIKAATGEDVP